MKTSILALSKMDTEDLKKLLKGLSEEYDRVDDAMYVDRLKNSLREEIRRVQYELNRKDRGRR